MKTAIIGLKDLRENTEKYISRIERGQSFVVIKKSKPVFRLSPADDEPGMWEPVIDFTSIHKDGVAAREALKELRKLNARS